MEQSKAYTDEVKNGLLNGAGDAYDTLLELGNLINENTNAIDALEAVATNKADKTHNHTVNDISDLTATAIELNYLSGVTSEVQTQINALVSRINELEATIGQVNAILDNINGEVI